MGQNNLYPIFLKLENLHTLLVGAGYSKAAYVYVKIEGQWELQQILTPGDDAGAAPAFEIQQLLLSGTSFHVIDTPGPMQAHILQYSIEYIDVPLQCQGNLYGDLRDVYAFCWHMVKIH